MGHMSPVRKMPPSIFTDWLKCKFPKREFQLLFSAKFLLEKQFEADWSLFLKNPALVCFSHSSSEEAGLAADEQTNPKRRWRRHADVRDWRQAQFKPGVDSVDAWILWRPYYKLLSTWEVFLRVSRGLANIWDLPLVD